MAVIFDYLDWRGDLGFQIDPDNEVDYYLLSMSYKISAIRKHWWKLKAELFPDVDEDVNSDIDKFITMLNKAQKQIQSTVRH